MKFNQCMSPDKKNNLIKKFYKNCDLKTSSRPFCAGKKTKHSFYWKNYFCTKLLVLAIYIKHYKGSNVIISVYDVINKILPGNSNYIADAAM